MNKAKSILSQLKLTNSFLSQVKTTNTITHNNNINTKKNILYYSTQQTNTVLELILDNKNKWSQDLETQLLHENLTHESIMYVLKKLDKDPKKASCFFNWVCNKNGKYALTNEKNDDKYVKNCGKIKLNNAVYENDTWVCNKNVQNDKNDEKIEKNGEKFSSNGFVYKNEKYEINEKNVKNGEKFSPNAAIYSLVLRVLAKKETSKEFWATVKKMKEEGFYIDLGTYLPVLMAFRDLKMAKDAHSWTELYKIMMKENDTNDIAKKVFSIVVKQDWGVNVERELKGIEIDFSENFVLRVFRELKYYPVKALSFFRWVGEDMAYEHNSVSYNAICRVLCGEESIDLFWSVFREMKSLGHEMDIDTYVKISRRLRKSKMLKDLVELYEEMVDGPYKPLPHECSMILRTIALSNSPDMDMVFRVVNKYEESGNVLMKADYDGIHRSLTSVGRFDEAEKIVESMRDAGYEPDNITYSQLVYGLCKARRLEEACEVLEEMRKSGCEPDLKTWTILIQGHCFADEVDKALLCFAKMIETNADPDADLLGVMVNGFLHKNKIGGAYKVFIEMVNMARLRPWQATYKILIEKLLEAKKFDEAMNLLHLMKKHNYPPFAEPFAKYIAKFGTVENADEFLKVLTVKDFPSITAYVHVFESFFRQGRHSEAQDLLYKCPFHIRKHAGVTGLFSSANNSSISAVA